MVRLREIPRTATFAWSAGSAPPLIATGTRAGAVDADFSNETQLELWDLALNSSEQAVELTPAASVSCDSRFHDIAWSQPSDDRPRGIIAGALESGNLDLWDAEKLLSGASDSFLSRTSKHSGAIKALQFNPFKPELLATAGAKGELYITDVNNINPFRLGTSAARADDFEALDWNKKVPYILATGSSGGFVTVWDLKTKKENLTLNNYGRKAVSAVAWDPDVPTKLMTAVPNDQDPLILMWDLRNSNAPERILHAHDQGVLSLSWCAQDSDILLSCGKDNRTICWNPHTGSALGEFPVVTNWTFQTKFNPHNPNLLATASFDGKIAVQTLQNAKNEVDATTEPAAQALDGEDFFARAQTQPQAATFSLPQTPKWLRKPVGVSFGFGGKLVKFSPDAATKKSKISISTFAVDSAIGEATEKFEEALQKGDLASICETKVAEAKTEEEKADWTVIETLISGKARTKLVEYLGFSSAPEAEKAEGEDKSDSAQANGTADKDDAAFFDESGDGDNFLSDLAATKGAKTNNPFKIFTGEESDADKDITKALMLGSFEKALDICLKEERLSDAFMIAICGGQKCIDKAQSAYFKRKSDGPNYLRLLASVVGKNLWDVVYNADLKDWREVMATLCTYADESDFPDLCEALGDRLEESINESSEAGTLRKDASFCYLAGSKLEKVVGNWAEELKESEDAGIEKNEGDTTFSIHARSLQNFIEKVTIFREVTKFQDTERQKAEDWKLAPLYAKYTEYADVVAAHGQLRIAEKYLDLLPDQYPAAEVARNRVKQATKKPAPQTQQRQSTAATIGQRPQRVVPAYQPVVPTPAATTVSPAATSAYVPPVAAAPVQPTASPYAPSNAAKGYTPVGYQQPQANVPKPGQPYGYGGYQPPQAQPLPPPPRGFSSSPAVAPASQSSGLSAWNDLPEEFGKKAPPRTATGTPRGAGAITSPFPGAPSVMSPPVGGSPYVQQARATPPPPPPKGPPQGPPRIASPAVASSPSSAAANAYAPPPQPQQFGPPQATIPRGPSPYNPPPSAAPPSNRYAPAPGAQPTPPPAMAAPPRQVAPNPYAPQQFGQPSPMPTPQAPPQGPPQTFAKPPPQGPPRAGPPPVGPPRTTASPVVPMTESRPSTAQSQRATPAPVKYPAGDRTHIPEDAKPIFEILSSDMARVKSKAPQNFMPQVLDTEKRLNILFDHLNNEDLLKPDTVVAMVGLSQHLQNRSYEEAQALFTDLMKNKNDEGSNWMVGVKRLIQMSRATPA
ncbi:uncharacterized protein K452DRAFT_251210 [Aplosporella prunicola CBS 121167]|uniref:Protein transport protein SEC31 n=1 Tax=Aplosporella prunicola CBS 121167 TaxID=1176127 RepID=A0A6A6BDN0_9PEZI|nr:uncharacterized protein K452DRAFT_251210 [Aplosporella prunicola CBS 121167]KAF2141344.1 hypothetical protein K452DRAFT_251210 [Aplosporella prunicola CBS 121167]